MNCLNYTLSCTRVATFHFPNPGRGSVGEAPSRWGVREYHPEKTFEIVCVIWYILMQCGSSYLYAAVPGTFVTLQ